MIGVPCMGRVLFEDGFGFLNIEKLQVQYVE